MLNKIELIKHIPSGDYCYTIVDIDKDSDGVPIIKTKTCKFYEYVGQNNDPFCSFVNRKDDVLLGDQCKICGINIGDENE